VCWAEYHTSVRQTVLTMMSRDNNANNASKSDARRTFMSLSEYFHQYSAASISIRSPHHVIVMSLFVTDGLLCSHRRWGDRSFVYRGDL